MGVDTVAVPAVEPEDVKKAIDTHEDCVILDVRTVPEYARGKIAGSINIPVDDIVEKIRHTITDTSTRVYVYCLSGNRSTRAVGDMVKLGYTNVFNMQYGMLGWRAKYFPTVT